MRRLIIFMFFVLLLAGCSTTKEVYLKNMKSSNLNYNGDNVPITIVLYKLNDIIKFSKAVPSDLLEREDVILGKDKIDSSKLQIAPEDTLKLATVDKKKAKYVAILVIYNRITGKKLKSAILTDKIRGKKLVFATSKKGVFIYGKKNHKRELISGE